jgi:DNA-binding response OmpR family regulator
MAGDLVADLDLALAALRRVIMRAIETAVPRTSIPGKDIPAPAAKKVTAPPPAPKPHPQPVVDRRPPAIANGVCVDFATSTVTFGGKSISVLPRHADAVAVLARAIPNVIPRAEIAKRAWLDLSPSSGEVYVAEMREPLTARLASIGLALKVIPKFGLALMPAEKAQEPA